MPKYTHEIRDPVHAFLKVTTEERDVVNSKPFQRLREIQQLALTHLVYPGATHRRFEHSLGVMELATRAFDVVTHPESLTDDVKELVPEIGNPDKLRTGRKLVRMAALLHDVGHLPFSHAGEERELLPPNWNHEFFSFQLILRSELANLLKALDLSPVRVARIAVGVDKVQKIKENAPELLKGIESSDLDFLRLGPPSFRADRGRFRGRPHGLSLARFPSRRGRLRDLRPPSTDRVSSSSSVHQETRSRSQSRAGR
ncbi:MAG: HD domain-containing protein [Candidatus Eremiobacterota bacterium]